MYDIKKILKTVRAIKLVQQKETVMEIIFGKNTQLQGYKNYIS